MSLVVLGIMLWIGRRAWQYGKYSVKLLTKILEGAWVDVDDLNNKEIKGEIKSVVHYTKEGL